MRTYGHVLSPDSGVFDFAYSLPDEADDEIAWAKLTLRRYHNSEY